MTRATVLVGALGAAAGVALQLTLVSGWAAPPAGPAPEGRAVPGEITRDRRPPVLEAVPELARPVTYTETKISLGELVRKVAAETGAPLVAARSVADEPVAVAVSDLPARELLEQLAELLDYQWARHGKDGA